MTATIELRTHPQHDCDAVGCKPHSHWCDACNRVWWHTGITREECAGLGYDWECPEHADGHWREGLR